MAGSLLLIGGAEDKTGSRTILNRFVHLAGAAAARIVVIPTASSLEETVGQHYATLFAALGAAWVEVLPVRSRIDAMQSDSAELLDNASAIFLTGGDQLKLMAQLGGTPVARRITERNQAGCVIAGTSAGASAAAAHMLAYGAGGIPPRKAMMQFAPGLGLITGVVIDQHFSARGRTGRLITAVAHNPALLGIGIDEDTAVEINDSMLTVLGRGAVLVVDGGEMSYTDIYRIPEQVPLTIFNLRLHTLAASYRYDLAARVPLMPEEQ